MTDRDGFRHGSDEYMGCDSDHVCRRIGDQWTIVTDEPEDSGPTDV